MEGRKFIYTQGFLVAIELGAGKMYIYRTLLPMFHQMWLFFFILIPVMCQHQSSRVWSNVSCPALCRCAYENFIYDISGTSLATIDCSDADLTRVPSNISSSTEALVLKGATLSIGVLGQIPANLTLLDLSYCQLYTLNYGLPIMPYMKYLQLAHNQLDYLANRTFQTLPTLSGLYLSHNTIEVLHADALRGLSQLRTLDLSHNRLFSLDVRWFRQLTSLKNLLLHDNNIHQVPGRAFSDLSSLEILTLHSNQIKDVCDDAFRGLASLTTLFLSDNHLAAITSKPFHVFKDLDLLDLSNNHLQRLGRGSLQSFNVSTLRLANMKDLRIIERRAIVNIGTLKELDLSDNPSLMYIERRAFVNVPKLQRLHLHSSNLSTLEAEVTSGLTGLTTLTLYDNPFYCDCTVAWLIKLANKQSRHNVTLEKQEQMLCVAGPPDLQSRSLQSLSAGQLTGQCAPRILPFPESLHEVMLGDTIRFDCRAVGQPLPQIVWLLPTKNDAIDVKEGEARSVKASSQLGSDGRISVDESGTLRISVIENGDQGQWTCIASSPLGRSQRSTSVRLRNPQAQVILISVTPWSISVTWRSSRYLHDYQIMYREVNVNESYTNIEILPYMRSFTASDLTADTKYEFCIAITHQGSTSRLNCTVITTKVATSSYMGTVVDAKGTVLGAILACLSVLLVFITVIYVLIRRYNKRRRSAEELLGADYLSQVYLAGMDAMSDTTPITYENRGIDLGSEEEEEEEEEEALTDGKQSVQQMYR